MDILGVVDLVFPALLLGLVVLEHVDPELVEFFVEVVGRDDVDGELDLLDGVLLGLQLFLHRESQLDELLLLLVVLLALELVHLGVAASSTAPVVVATSLVSLEVVAFGSLFVRDAVLDLTIHQRLVDDEFDFGVGHLANLEVRELLE